MPSSYGDEEWIVQIVVTELHELPLRVTKRVVRVKHLHVLLARPSQQISGLNWILTSQQNTLQQLLALFIIAKNVIQSFTAFTYCENIIEMNKELSKYQFLKMLILQNF